MKPAIHQDNRGLSMAEMVFAMTLLFLVATFVMSMFIQGSRQMAQAAQNHDLASLTRTKLTEIRAMPFGDLDSLPGAPTGFPAPNDQFTYSVQFLDFNGEDQAVSRTVELTVSHPTYGSRVVRTVRSLVQPPDPGQVAWEKFGCATCHSIPSAGYPDDGYMIPLEPIGALNPGVTRPGPWDSYISESVQDPNAFDPFPAGGGVFENDVMLDYNVEGDASYDPNTGVSSQELSDMAAWIATFQP